MAERLLVGVQTQIDVGSAPQPAKAAPGSPFRILFVGDFSGRASRSPTDPARIAQARPRLIDRDNFDEVMQRLGAELQLRPLGGDSPPIGVKIASLEDFHPDRLYDSLDVFAAFREARRKLADPKTFAQAKAEVTAWAGAPAEKKPEQPAQAPGVAPAPPAASGAALLDQMLGETPSERAAVPGERGWNAFLRELAAPHIVPAANPMQAELTGYVDAAVGAVMRAILHDAGFQALEAAWRALAMAVKGLETGTDLKLYLLDASKAELAADLADADELRKSGWHRLLVNEAAETFGADAWAIVAADYTFDDSAADAATLDRIARVAQAAGAPFVANAGAAILGCCSLAQTPDPDDWPRRGEGEGEGTAWDRLRHAPHSRYLGLALPRILLRLPYGRKTEAVERFSFEETDGNWQHDDYLWGGPAVACALLLGHTFSAAGWEFSGALARDIEGLPLHVYRDGGEAVTKPCAEIWLTERAAERMIRSGLIPLASIKGEDRVRLVRLQSVASGETALAGRWS